MPEMVAEGSRSLEDGQVKFFLSQCGQTYCEPCLKPDAKCPRCGCRTVRINKREALLVNSSLLEISEFVIFFV
jgi:hypothetical protein